MISMLKYQERTRMACGVRAKGYSQEDPEIQERQSTLRRRPPVFSFSASSFTRSFQGLSWQ